MSYVQPREFQQLLNFIEKNIPEGGVLGFDGRVVTFGEGKTLSEKLKAKNATIKYEVDLVDEIWEDRPELSKRKAFYLDVDLAGETATSKLERVRKEMKEAGANIHIITSLDDTGWLLNDPWNGPLISSRYY